MSLLYIGDAAGFYGTAFGVMVGAKIALFLMLLALGGMNFLMIERLRASPDASATRLRRFAEAELGIGIAIFFAAASLTSVPPAVDLTRDRVTWAEIIARNTPEWPRLTSPDYDSLALPALRHWTRRPHSAKPRRRLPSRPGPGNCRPATPTTSPGPNTTTTGPASSSASSACWRC